MTAPHLHENYAPLRIVPCTIQDAKEYVRQHHRHHAPPMSGLFALAVAAGGKNGGGHGVRELLDPFVDDIAQGVLGQLMRKDPEASFARQLRL